jgi:hypothetical protein
MAVPNIFGTATAAIPLSQLDQNFATAITLGNTAVYLGNTTTSLGNVTLTNVTISSGTSNIAANVSTAVGLLPEAQGGTGTTTGYYGFKNRIINGAMVIDQRNAGAAVTTASAFPVDRFSVPFSTDGAFSAQQDSSAPAGFVNSLKFTTTTADASLSAAQFAFIRHNIEGLNSSDLAWGTASAQAVTLSFWVRSSLTGTFGGALTNSAVNRSYIFNYAISAADTWEYKTVTIDGDTSGTWLTTNGVGIRLEFSMGAGSNFQGTAGSWTATSNRTTAASVSVIGTLNATWQITGVQLEKGSTATSFDYRPYGTELALCQRYYETKDWSINTFRVAVVYTNSQAANGYQEFAVTKRASPQITWSSNGSARYVYSGGAVGSQTLTASTISVSGASFSTSSTFTAGAGWVDSAGTMQISSEL